MSGEISFQVYTDGGARGNPGPAASGVVVFDEKKALQYEEAHFLGEHTNNEAEYEAFLRSLRWVSEHQNQAKNVRWHLDSLLVVEQLTHHWKIKEARLRILAQQAWQLLAKLTIPYQIVHVPRAQNAHADALVNRALDLAQKTT